MAIELPRPKQKELIESIRRYFSEKLEDDIGDLKASLLLDYVLVEIGPAIYNQAVADAQSYFQEKTTDVDDILHEPELGYWS